MMETEQAKTDAVSGSGTFDEKAAIARVQKGDKEAFSGIVKQYQNRLYNTIYRMISSAEDAFDICQEVFLKAFRNIKSFRGDSAFLTYLYRIAFNESVMYRNKRKRMIAVDFKSNPHCLIGLNIANNNSNHIEKIQTEDSNKYVQNALNSLDPDLREVVVLKDVDDFSYAEIAQALNISVSTVRTNLEKGRVILRGKLKDLL
ncbi:MAG: sigma-70 family RNA polymerase sigma factor [Planctomycetes bacterium]|nr:sigma-70 family RNA polymerase sigma factor [Planctomycetota bacterium]